MDLTDRDFLIRMLYKFAFLYFNINFIFYLFLINYVLACVCQVSIKRTCVCGNKQRDTAKDILQFATPFGPIHSSLIGHDRSTSLTVKPNSATVGDIRRFWRL